MYYLLNLSNTLSAADQIPDITNISAPTGIIITTRITRRNQLSALQIRLSFFLSILLPPVSKCSFPIPSLYLC